MKLFRFNSKLCSLLFFSACLILCGILAWSIGEAHATEAFWVAREKIAGAEPYTMIEQANVGRGLLFGIPAFILGGVLSAVLSELYYAALCFFRGENR